MHIKKIILAFLSASFFTVVTGCNSASSNDKSSEAELADIPSGFTTEYEKADFEKYNSYASENGLAETLIYVEGTLGELNMMYDEENDYYRAELVDLDGNNWSIFYDAKQVNLKENWDILEEQYSSLEGDNVVICGAYMGYSGKYEMPTIECIKIFDRNKNKTIITGNGKVQEYSPEYDSEFLAKIGEQSLSKGETEEQSNAIKDTYNYVDKYSFSATDLIARLEADGYSTVDAIYAVSHIDVDWNEEAAKLAKTYMTRFSFSKEDLIDQLEYDGFTSEQAEYAATAVGY